MACSLLRNDYPVWKFISPLVQNNNGSYTLSWTVPLNVGRYQIKYSNKNIVEWLGYNPATQIYQYDPAVYTPFFAASNLTSEVVPQVAGSVQTLTLNNLSCGSGCKFAIKYLPTSGNPSPYPNTYSLSNFIQLIANWNKTILGSPADVNNDGIINTRDLGKMMSSWQ